MDGMQEGNRILRLIESRRLWAPFHKDWLLAIREILRPQLPAEYAIFVESEAIVVAPVPDGPAKPLAPDLFVARPETGRPPAPSPGGRRQATLEVVESCEVSVQYTLQVRRAPEDRVVAVCEILSPTNKGVHGDAEKRRYLRKREEYLSAAVSILEVDGLLEGERLLPPHLTTLRDYARNAWSVHQRDGHRSWRGWGWDEDDEPPAVDWLIEEDLRADVLLASALDRALAFNPWKRILGYENEPDRTDQPDRIAKPGNPGR